MALQAPIQSPIAATTLAPSGGLYLLPDDANTVIHVNANDLCGGTARIGPAWTQNGTVPFNDGSGAFPSSAGPFSGSNYFSQVDGPLAFQTSSFTVAIIFEGTLLDTELQPLFFLLGANTQGSYLYLSSTDSGGTGLFGDLNANVSAQAAALGPGLHILMGGFNGNEFFCQLDDTPINFAGETFTAPTAPNTAYLGKDPSYTAPGYFSNGTIVEFWASNAPGDATVFTPLWDAFRAQFVNANRYLIPTTANVVTHVSGTDLAAGTAKVGGAWNLNGAVPFNVGEFPVPSVGPFSDTNFFAQAPSSPANISSGPATYAVVFKPTSTTGLATIFSTGLYAGGGVSLFNNAGVPQAQGKSAEMPSSAPIVSGDLGILLVGVDGSGNGFITYNGVSGPNVSFDLSSASTTNSFIGRYPSNGNPLTNGEVYEVMVSTDVPSAAAFTALTKSIVANIPGLNRYNIPTTPNVLNHVNALDLYNGTAKAGTPWAADGVAPINISASGTPATMTVGPLDDTNYFSQPTPVVAAAPWTCAIIVNTTDATPGMAIGNGTYLSDGWYLYVGAGDVAYFVINTTVVGTIIPTANTLISGQNVIIFGFDVSGTGYVQLNGGTTAFIGTGVLMAPPLHNLLLGKYNTAGGPFNGSVQEVMISSDVPSAGAFNNLYAAIAANLG